MATARCSLVPTGSGARAVWEGESGHGKGSVRLFLVGSTQLSFFLNVEYKNLVQPIEQLTGRHCRRISICASDKIEYYARLTP